MEYIFDKTYFHNYSPELRYLYVAYSLCGGMYYEAYMNTRFKYSWSFLGLCSALQILFNSLIALLLTDAYDFSSLCIIAENLSMTIWIFYIVSFTYYWRKNFHKFFAFLKKQDSKVNTLNNDEVKNGYKKINLKACFLMSTIAVIFLVMSMLIIRLTRYFLKNGFDNTTHAIDCIQDYMQPFPLIKSPSPITYVIICILQSIAFLCLIGPCISISFLFYTVITCIENQATILRNSIKLRSDFTFEKLELCFTNEEKILSSNIAWNLKQKKLMMEQKIRERYTEEFFIDFCQWIRSQQELTAYIHLIKKYVETTLQFVIVLTSLDLICCGYYAQKVHISSISTDFNGMNREILLPLLIVVPMLLCCCWIGNTFAELNTKLLEEVNNSPWYCLPPTKRRLFLTFLCLTQRPMNLRIFRIYTVTLSMFPVILKKALDFIQLMWIIENRKP